MPLVAILTLSICSQLIRVADLFYLTMGGDDQFCLDLPWEPMHPGYMGADRLLDAPVQMVPGELNLYHCLVAASGYAKYMDLALSERAVRAGSLRCATIRLIREDGASSQADRLMRSGYDGYPVQDDFYYIAKASGVSFEVEQHDLRCARHYGIRPISARLLLRKVADGAGHLSDHFDLAQIYYDSRQTGNGRWRLWRKTAPSESIWGSVDRPPVSDDGDVKLADLWRHKSTIAEAIAAYPAYQARALSFVLQRDYGLFVKWKALQNYILREHLWTSKRPKPAAAIESAAASSASMPVAAAIRAGTSMAPSPTISEAKIGDLPRYRGTIIVAIRANPGKKAKALAAILAKDYAIKVHWDALRVYIDREKLYDLANVAPTYCPYDDPSDDSGSADSYLTDGDIAYAETHFNRFRRMPLGAVPPVGL